MILFFIGSLLAVDPQSKVSQVDATDTSLTNLPEAL
jgi:hypothetical protein